MYSLIVRDYSIADIEAFSALSIRRGSTIASLAKASSDNLRIVTGAWLLFLPKAADEAAVRASAERFLAGPGAWMNETPEGLVAAALESGLLEKTFEGFANGLAPRPNVTAARLTDELETAAAILAARRARTREALQAKNRAVNSGEPPVDDEADRRFMTEALAEARAAAQAGEVPVGAVIVVQPGEKVPIDGTVVEGTSTLDTAALTGESLPRDIQPGEEIISGCINLTGLLKVRTTKEFGESTVSKILDLVENASSRKSKSEDFISRFARIYTPAVCYAALALAILPPLVLTLGLGQSPAWETWIYRALTFLVASCPCALVISIPLSFFGGIGGASKQGILVKGGNYLEALAQAGIVVFDKTGTLTKGSFEVTAVHPQQVSEQELLELAALAERFSDHPISRSIQAACQSAPDPNRVTDAKEIAGHGVRAVVDGKTVLAGNQKLMDQFHISFEDTCHHVGTIIHVAVDGVYMGHIVISDQVKEGAEEALRDLKAAGVRKTVMLTGDNERTARAIGAQAGVDQVIAGVLPDGKESVIRSLKEKGKVAMVGDGINDAPVLMRSDVGIAMGGIGSDSAIEAADVVLMDDDPMKIAKAIKISRKCIGIVYQNIIFALAIKAACLLLGALGIANMWAAIFADVGVMVLAVLNATRALYTKDLVKKDKLD